jgi:hypothetical protein
VVGLAVGKRLGARLTGAGAGLDVPLVHELKTLHETGELARMKSGARTAGGSAGGAEGAGKSKRAP